MESEIQLLTLEEVKTIIINYANENKIYPIARQLLKDRKELHRSYSTYVKYYGISIMDIIKSCDLPYEFQDKTDKYTNKDILDAYIELAKNLGRTPSFSDVEEYRKYDKSIPSAKTMRERFGSMENVAGKAGFYKSTITNGKYKKDFLINEIKRYYDEYGKIPNQKEIDEDKNYPSRKTFTGAFGSFNNVLREAGFDIKDKPDYNNKEYLLSEIKRYIVEFGKQPFSKDMDATKGYPSKSNYQNVFGSWNNAIKELGLTVRISSYSEKELDDAFLSFVTQYGRPPILHEFNTDARYPSFWCYQNRFGSWNKTLIHYGFTPNEGAAGTYKTFDNGEICKSTYEFDVSNWLRKNNISYLRNVPYKDFVDEYEGKKDCDYVLIHRGEFIWLEIAGLYTSREKKSGMERGYVKAFDHKLENLLSQFYYKVLYPNDFKNINYEEIFEFLNEIESYPWFEGEPIYRGMPDEFDKVV